MKNVALTFIFAASIINCVFAFTFDGLKKTPIKKSSNEFLGVQKFKEDGGSAFRQGAVVISAGYGYGGGLIKTIIKEYEDESNYNFSSLGPVHFRGEMGLSDNIGLVLSINHNSWKATWQHTDETGTIRYYDEFKRTVTSFLGRINVHFATTDQLDPYFGIGAGYRSVDYSFTSTDLNYDRSVKSPFNIGFETTLGLRYYFTENIGVYTELGFSQSIVQGGLAVKF